MCTAFLLAVLVAQDDRWLTDLAKRYYVDNAESELASVKKARIRKGTGEGFATAEDKKTAIADAQKRLAVAKRLAEGVREIPELVGQRSNLAVKGLVVGDAGRFPGTVRGTLNDIGVFQVIRVVDERSAVIELKGQGARDDPVVWIEGINTKNLVDGQWSNIMRPVRVVEPKRFGGQTIPQLVAWTDAEIEKFFRLIESQK